MTDEEREVAVDKQVASGIHSTPSPLLVCLLIVNFFYILYFF